jgi:uroporphyrinogen decarboxylase
LSDIARYPACRPVGIDHGTDLAWAARELPKDIVLQGNLDPLSLIDGGQAMQDAVTHILDVCDGRPHIFNLGHGITPETPMAHVDALISMIRD